MNRLLYLLNGTQRQTNARLPELFADAGLEVVTLFGDYDESPYTPGASPFIIAVLGTPTSVTSSAAP